MGWERRPKLQYPAPHTGHHSPCCQSSGRQERRNACEEVRQPKKKEKRRKKNLESERDGETVEDRVAETDEEGGK